MTSHAIDTILERAGYDRHSGALRRVTARHCPRCRQPVLAGLNADVAALTDTVDPTPVNPAGELAALLTGRYSCDLRWTGRRYELDHRGAHQIQTRPADSDPRAEVVVQHRCGEPVHPDHTARRRPAAANTPDITEPPF